MLLLWRNTKNFLQIMTFCPVKRFAETIDTDEVIVAQPDVSVEIATRLVTLWFHVNLNKPDTHFLEFWLILVWKFS